MGEIWPILLQCSSFNDVRYGLLNKEKMKNTNLVKTGTH